MKFLKIKKNIVPSLKSLKPAIFNTDAYWDLSLGIFIVLAILIGTIGLRLFWRQYFENYSEFKFRENIEEVMNIGRLKSAVEERNEFLNKEIIIPRNPSL